VNRKQSDAIATAALLIVHHHKCRRPISECPPCLILAERASDDRGSMDVAIADLETALRKAGLEVE
jgi:hypothetical protein